MYSKETLCKKIIELYPDIGTCGINVNVAFDDGKKVWVVDMKKGEQHLKHYLEVSDADYCIDGKKCVPLGLEIAQLKKNIEGKQF